MSWLIIGAVFVMALSSCSGYSARRAPGRRRALGRRHAGAAPWSPRSTVEGTVELAVPVRAAYEEWTQFEGYPRFMEGVETVRRTDDTHLRWAAQLGGVRREWDAAITEQLPERRIAWRSADGGKAGVVWFQPLDEGHSQVTLRLDVEPQHVAETWGETLGSGCRRVAGDLERFKEMIESRAHTA